MRLLNKIFGNRDDPETAAGEGSDESSPERQTIELEPYELSAGDEPRATSEQSGRLTFAPPSEATSLENAASSDEQPHELTRRRIARPTVPTVEVPPIPPPIPAATAEDPEEIDVSDQLDEVNGEADLDGSDLIVEDDEPKRDDEEEEDTNTSVSIWGAAAASPPSSPAAASEPAVKESSTAALSSERVPVVDAMTSDATSFGARPLDDGADAEQTQGSTETVADGSGSISPNTIQPDPEWTRMPIDTPKQTLVEVGTEFTGTMKSSCPVVVNGTLDGEIDAPTLSVTSTGTILGNIRAKTLRSSGTLAGKVDAGEVYVSGAVRSNTVIRARRLELKIGSPDKGHLEVTLGAYNVESSDAPAASDAGSPPSAITTTTGAGSEASAEGEGETSGSVGWDLPEADGSTEPARARKRSK